MSTLSAVMFRSGATSGGWSESDTPAQAEVRQRKAYAIEDRLSATKVKLAEHREELRRLEEHEGLLSRALSHWHSDRDPQRSIGATVPKYKGL